MSIKPSRTALVAFFNDTLQLNILKVDDLGNGAAYCQLLDSIYGDIPMHRVKFNTRVPLEIEQNYKVLQQAFVKHRINRNFDSIRLMKCRLQDNLDFSQWLYQFWHESPHIEGYDPVARRAGSNGSVAKVKRAPSVVLSTKITAPPQSHASKNLDPERAMRSLRVQAPDTTPGRTPVRQKSLSASENGIAFIANQRIASLEEEIDELGRSIDVLYAERGLYYHKLLDIEEFINQQLDKLYEVYGDTAAMELAEDPRVLLLRQIQAILFSSPDGFKPPTGSDDEPF